QCPLIAEIGAGDAFGDSQHQAADGRAFNGAHSAQNHNDKRLQGVIFADAGEEVKSRQEQSSGNPGKSGSQSKAHSLDANDKLLQAEDKYCRNGEREKRGGVQGKWPGVHAAIDEIDAGLVVVSAKDDLSEIDKDEVNANRHEDLHEI